MRKDDSSITLVVEGDYMATIVWDEVGKRLYETGVSKGVFYDHTGLGVAWNGLTSVEENTSHQVQPVYFDGLKFNDIVTIGDFAATIRAFTYPDEFLPYEGILSDYPGFFVTGQLGNRFGLSYQTKLGNDVEGNDLGYKIHLLYNLTAIPTQKTFNTMALELEPTEFEWSITSIPEIIDDFCPTAHVIIDSRTMDPYLLADLENTIYGSAYDDPTLPPLSTIIAHIQDWFAPSE
jgi:hypothetical protein